MNEQFPVSFGWRLPNDARLKVTFQAEVIAYQPDKDRWLIRLAGPPPALDAQVPADIRQAIEALPGRWVFVPSEARRGVTLPLKLETLTGRIRYFYAHDPRSEQPSSRTQDRPSQPDS
ncbi:MAG: hypothetical protein RMN25_06025 [Anaerolineae bacterium]|nr:hypothetical protein [Thermoflexales bacterium]MDW8407324.1 hypothetical protein [Anaerolineae bacterium]